MNWIVREGRSSRYLYICRQEGETIAKIAEIDLWAGTKADASLMAAAPRLYEILKRITDPDLPRTPEGIIEAWAALKAAAEPFVQEYKPAVSAE